MVAEKQQALRKSRSENAPPTITTVDGDVLLASRGETKNLTDILTETTFSAEKIEIQRRADKTVADLMETLIKGNQDVADQTQVIGAMSKIGAAVDAVVAEMKE